ncbi:glutaredoxin family protein [Shewanella surugensis]|uniref:Glutaredoxin family protein n=1 Tax=Shewanella surugensis TaxID=212020 RepID=A0ABT0LI74_9GAMM|nr:glutaredoxin family protein [Shewanella surugensis]MCL1127002.1 glutaredoxin family protein [Shewanella surugensis]
MPNKSMDYVLYGTDGCHLCELAEALLMNSQIEVQKQDICDDEQLVEHYGTTIPVLKKLSTGQALCWPFTLVQIKELMRSVV